MTILSGIHPAGSVKLLNGIDPADVLSEFRLVYLIVFSVLYPVDDVESALKLNAEDFRSTYHFEKPLPSSLIVLYCRSGKRAGRAVEIFRDKFGYKK